jgi:oxalate decarboxylase
MRSWRQNHWPPVRTRSGVGGGVPVDVIDGIVTRRLREQGAGAAPWVRSLPPSRGGSRVSVAAMSIFEARDIPQPQRHGSGATDPGPRNLARDRQNPDVLVPPATDSGTIPNLRFSFSDAHNRLEPGGWAREVTQRELPVATTLAGVNMRLDPGGVREMHWHKQAEWSYMLDGRARITAIDQEGRTFAEDVGAGDIWYFPPGIPHSIQGLAEGCEFLLVFDDGAFSENATFLLSDWFAHTPRSVLAKNFGVRERDLAGLPESERYIFSGTVPGPLEVDRVPGPVGPVPHGFSHRMLAQEPVDTGAGTARITDSANFPVSKTVAAALVEIQPGAMRELHWHPTNDEWSYVIEGQARMTVFASAGHARTFDFRAGDVGYVPFAMGHYVENTGDTPVRFLEVFRSDRFADVSLNQWMALTPHQLVQEHLHLGEAMMGALRETKRPVV